MMPVLEHKVFFLMSFLMTLLLASSWLQGEESTSSQVLQPSIQGETDHSVQPIQPSPQDHTSHAAHSKQEVEEHNHSLMSMPSTQSPPPNPQEQISQHDPASHAGPSTQESEGHDHSLMSMPSPAKSSSKIGHEQHSRGGSDKHTMKHQMMMKQHHTMNAHLDRLLPSVEHTQYLKECGSCHYPYQPALLPSRSWERLLNELSNHFGDNAQLEEDILKEIHTYVVEHAADKIGFGRPEIFAMSIPNQETPLRITETKYFQQLHGNIPTHYVITNPRVHSLSQCGACHQEAQQGFFNAQEVSIPGVNNLGMCMMGNKIDSKMEMK